MVTGVAGTATTSKGPFGRSFTTRDRWVSRCPATNDCDRSCHLA